MVCLLHCYCQYQCSTAPWKPPHFSVTPPYTGVGLGRYKSHRAEKTEWNSQDKRPMWNWASPGYFCWVWSHGNKYNLWTFPLYTHTTRFFYACCTLPIIQTLKAKLWNENRNPALCRVSQTTHPLSKDSSLEHAFTVHPYIPWKASPITTYCMLWWHNYSMVSLQ